MEPRTTMGEVVREGSERQYYAVPDLAGDLRGLKGGGRQPRSGLLQQRPEGRTIQRPSGVPHEGVVSPKLDLTRGTRTYQPSVGIFQGEQEVIVAKGCSTDGVSSNQDGMEEGCTSLGLC